MRLVLIGPPGAGKGTQASILSRELDVPHISTGDVFRDHVARQTPLGREAKSYLEAGRLVPNEVTNEMVRRRLLAADAQGGFLLDGYPRTVAQAQHLTNVLAETGGEIDAVVQFAVPEDVVVARLLLRGRHDDTELVIRHRQKIYRNETSPLLAYYASSLLTIDADGPVNEIAARAVAALQEPGAAGRSS